MCDYFLACNMDSCIINTPVMSANLGQPPSISNKCFWMCASNMNGQVAY